MNYSKFASNIGCPNIWNEKATEHDDFHPRNGWFEADDVSGSASEFAFGSRWTSNFVSPESALEHGKVLDVFRLPSGQTSLAQKKTMDKSIRWLCPWSPPFCPWNSQAVFGSIRSDPPGMGAMGGMGGMGKGGAGASGGMKGAGKLGLVEFLGWSFYNWK